MNEAAGVSPIDYASLGLPPPRQARSRKTLEKIMDATEELLESAPFERISIQEITERAGIACGSFYTRFPEKGAVLSALFVRYLEFTERQAAALERAVPKDAPLHGRVGSVVSMMVTVFRARRGVSRAAQLHFLRHPEEVSEDMRDRLGCMYERVAGALRGDGRGIVHADAEWATRFAVQMVAATCRAKILFTEHPVPDDAAASDERLTRELSRAVIGYLSSPTEGVAS